MRFYEVQVLGDGDDGFWVGGLPAQLRLITVGQAFVQPGQQVLHRPAAGG